MRSCFRERESSASTHPTAACPRQHQSRVQPRKKRFGLTVWRGCGSKRAAALHAAQSSTRPHRLLDPKVSKTASQSRIDVPCTSSLPWNPSPRCWHAFLLHRTQEQTAARREAQLPARDARRAAGWKKASPRCQGDAREMPGRRGKRGWERAEQRKGRRGDRGAGASRRAASGGSGEAAGGLQRGRTVRRVRDGGGTTGGEER